MNKNYLFFASLLFCLPFLLLFFFLNQYYSFIVSFIVALIILYSIYLCKVLLECLLIIVFVKVKINYLIICPFTYDSKILFNPLSLLYNYDGFQNSMYLNIDLTLPLDQTNKLVKRILVIAKLSLILSSIFIGLILVYFSTIMILPIILLFPITLGVFSYLKFTEFSYGANYFINSYGIDVYLLQSNGFKNFNPSCFIDFLDNKKDEVTPSILLKILENFIFNLIYNNHLLNQRNLKQLVHSILEIEYYFYQEQYSPQFQTRYINLIKLIAVVYHKNFSHDTLLDIDYLLKNYRNYLISLNEYEILDNSIESINFFLMNYKDDHQIVNIAKDLIFDLRPIFYYQKHIENIIKNHLYFIQNNEDLSNKE